VHWAEFALGPDAQCVWPTPRRRLGPRAQRVHGPRPRGPWPRPAARAARRLNAGAQNDGEAAAHRRGVGDDGAATAGAMRRRQRRGQRRSERRGSDSSGRDGGCRAAAVGRRRDAVEERAARARLSGHKNTYFVSGYLRRPIQKMKAYFL
jgi:hypothetical protein